MTKPTKEQIRQERIKLLEIMPKVRRFSAFGDDHHAAIKATLRVLDGRDSSEDYEDAPDNVRDEVYNAEQWMNGEADPEYGSPTESWSSLLQK